MEDDENRRGERPNGAIVRQLRRQKGYTLVHCAEFTKVGQRTIQRMEAGEIVDMNSIRLYAEAFGVSYESLLSLPAMPRENADGEGGVATKAGTLVVTVDFAKLEGESDEMALERFKRTPGAQIPGILKIAPIKGAE